MLHFIATAEKDSIPTKPIGGCPVGTKSSPTDETTCCCNNIEKCCWNECLKDGTSEILNELQQCGVEKEMWSFGKKANSDTREWIPKRGKDKEFIKFHWNRRR